MRLLSNMVGDNETNFPHKLLLTNRWIRHLCKTFANKWSTDIELSKTQLPNMIQLGGFLGRPLGPLLKIGLPLHTCALIFRDILCPKKFLPMHLTFFIPTLPCDFWKNVFFIKRMEPWFSVIFNIILKYTFLKKFIESPQVMQKIWKNFIAILINFPTFFGVFYKETNFNLKQMISAFFLLST